MADTDELEALAAGLEQTGDYRVLRRVPTLRRGLIVDVESTGLDPVRDKIIEPVLLPFDFSSDGGL